MIWRTCLISQDGKTPSTVEHIIICIQSLWVSVNNRKTILDHLEFLYSPSAAFVCIYVFTCFGGAGKCTKTTVYSVCVIAWSNGILGCFCEASIDAWPFYRPTVQPDRVAIEDLGE